jgi:hypothetical protein
MLAAALAAQVGAHIPSHPGEVDVNGHPLAVRNGHHAEREVTTAAGGGYGAGAAAQRQAHRRGHRAAMPVFFGDPADLGTEAAADGGGVAAAVSAWPVHQRLRPALEQFPGISHRLSAATITRLTEQWVTCPTSTGAAGSATTASPSSRSGRPFTASPVRPLLVFGNQEHMGNNSGTAFASPAPREPELCAHPDGEIPSSAMTDTDVRPLCVHRLRHQPAQASTADH